MYLRQKISYKSSIVALYWNFLNEKNAILTLSGMLCFVRFLQTSGDPKI